MDNEETSTSLLDELFTRQTIYVTAAILLLSARRIARSTISYYVAAFIGGVFASTLVLAYLLRSFLPRSFSIVPLYLTSWPLSAYIFYKLWLNVDLLLNEYFSYLIAYFAVVLLLSCAVCYRFGTPTDERTLNLVQWGLQLGAVSAIYFSFRNHYLTIISVLVALLWPAASVVINHIGDYLSAILDLIRTKWFGPTPRQLLTEEEYRHQGVHNTYNELLKLRHLLVDQVCHDEIDTDRLRCSGRMSSFISGKSDMSDTELRDYSIYAKSGFTETPWLDREDKSSSSDDDDLNNEEEDDEPNSHPVAVKNNVPTTAAYATPDRPLFRRSPAVPNSGSRNGRLFTPTTESSSMANGSATRSALSNGSAARRILNGSGAVSTPSVNGSSPSTPLSSRRRTPTRSSLRLANGGRPYNSPLSVENMPVSATRRSQRRTGNFISSDEEEEE